MLLRVVLSIAVFLWGHAAAAPLTIPADRARWLYDAGDPAGVNWFHNPAALTYADPPSLACSFPLSGSDVERWGVAATLPGTGFSVLQERGAFAGITDYRIGAGVGNRGWNVGCAYAWSTGDTGAYHRTERAELGILSRPGRALSLGLTGLASLRVPEWQVVADLGIRPFRTASLTLAARYIAHRGEEAQRGEWVSGITWEPLRGIWLLAEVRDSGEVRAGTQIGVGGAAVGARTVYDSTVSNLHSIGSVILRGWDRSLADRRRKFVTLDLQGEIAYRPAFLFDRNTRTLRQVLHTIEDARDNETIAGIVVNTSGMQADAASVWEIRERLAALRDAGKTVVVYLDESGITQWYLSSAADRVVMHPLGILDIRGVAIGRFYLKHALDKIGVGFQEIRYRRYKSAVETFSLERMSDEDREQWDVYLDTFYARVRDDIAAARGIPAHRLDTMINERKILTAPEALQERLVDAVAVWESTEALAGICRREDLVQPLHLSLTRLPAERRWGPVPTIAVVYAAGVCAMDYGINARRLATVLDELAGNPLVAAVVVRVDSPGGSALAADVAAEAIRRCREAKPVVVSQGALAASGGYWLSMYGDGIVTSPFTITGSIGVIYGWAYNRGLREKLGVTTDMVKRGESADLELGMPLPLLGTLPDRPLNAQEFKRVDALMASAYDMFLDRVAAGRSLERSVVEAVAEGRIWSGVDAVERGLCDTLGGLHDAIEMARERAGIPPDRPLHIVELPVPELFPRRWPLPGLDITMGTSRSAAGILESLRLRVEYNGKPLLMLPDAPSLSGR